jgi:uncharacterized protein YecT (DUF1311 family)
MRVMFFVVLCIPLLAAASDVDENPCRDIVTNSAQATCFRGELEKVDRELNEEYQAVLKLAAGTQPLTRNLRSAQRAWLEFRDAELASLFSCAGVHEEVCFGKEFASNFMSEQIRLTRDRIVDLRQRRRELEES